MSVPLLAIKVHIFRIISLSIARKQKSMIELQTSVKTSKQDDSTRTRTPKPGYLKLTIVSIENSFNLDIILQLLLEKSSSSLQGGSVCLIG